MYHKHQGKSLSLICAALTWLELDRRRAAEGTLDQLFAKLKAESPQGQPIHPTTIHDDNQKNQIFTHRQLQNLIGYSNNMSNASGVS
jgi:hypothetical protein